MTQLARLHLEGFRSIESADIEFRPLNVLIGANGSGKSNLIDFFRLVIYALNRQFQGFYLPNRGPASHILHFGPRTTPVINAELQCDAEDGAIAYRFTLAQVRQDDTFLFVNEELQFQPLDGAPNAPVPLGPGGHRESGLSQQWSENEPAARTAKALLMRCWLYQFHDTGVDSHLRRPPFADDDRRLAADGGNLASVLLRLHREQPTIYWQILRNLQVVLPWLDDFVLEPKGPTGKEVVPLRWRMTGRGDHDFVAGQLSDGSLRIMALVTLLLLPADMAPRVCLIDEPELGLHPAAEDLICGLIKQAAATSQIVLATQSASFIDHFSSDDLIVTELEDGKTRFTRLSEQDLHAWRQRYTLSQIWSKNIIGGRP